MTQLSEHRRSSKANILSASLQIPAFVEHRSSLTPSQKLARVPYPELDELTTRRIFLRTLRLDSFTV
jgi:hypothetical protein